MTLYTVLYQNSRAPAMRVALDGHPSTSQQAHTAAVRAQWGTLAASKGVQEIWRWCDLCGEAQGRFSPAQSLGTMRGMLAEYG
jgi:hypothetical protein